MKRQLAVLALASTLAALLSACSSAGSAGPGLTVVASTSTWADVARQVTGRLAGSAVTVKAIITSPSADPHAYEATTRDELAIHRADVIVENGGGYDDFVQTMRSAGDAHAAVIDAVHVAHERPVNGDRNEHVWYDFGAVARVARRIADVLAAKDAPHAATYRANARAFAAHLAALQRREAAVRASAAGDGVAITEPVPLYLLLACGLVDRTPEAFSSAVEDGQDVPLRVLRQTKALFTEHQVRVLVYNAQTTDAQTTQVVAAARAAGVPVVPVTETLPTGLDYLGWMSRNLSAVEAALAGSRP